MLTLQFRAKNFCVTRERYISALVDKVEPSYLGRICWSVSLALGSSSTGSPG